MIIPDIPYYHLYYYQNTDIVGWKARYKPVTTLELEDIKIESCIRNLYNSLKNRNQKYILIGHSYGIYYAIEFARLYPKLVEHIISLDGSWITIKLCKQRLINWSSTGKKN